MKYKLTVAATALVGLVLATLPVHPAMAAPAASAAISAFDVCAFGAKGDGKTLDTPAFNNAIAAAKAGGGYRQL